MNRSSTLSLLVVGTGIAIVLATTAESQVGPPKQYVALQPSTPGTSQSGHINVDGTIRSTQLVGGGAGVTGVNADLLDGLNSTNFLQVVPVPTSMIGSVTSEILRVENNSTNANSAAILGISNSTTGNTHGVIGTSAAVGGRGVYGQANHTFGNNYGVFGLTLSSVGRGVYGYAISTANSQATGVEGLSDANSGRGVVGSANDVDGPTFGGHFRSLSSAGTGLLGWATNSTGATKGTAGQSSSTTGIGVYGEASASSGVNFGAKFTSASNQGYGAHVTGIGPDALLVENTGAGRGMLVLSNTDTAIWANATSAFAGIDGRNGHLTGHGIFGNASGATGVNYGVSGQTASPIGWGVYAFGNLGASGVKSFRIDHPADPENKYLLHYSSESPKPQNFYLGNITTDEKGYAWVELPEYLAEINTNFKYQLTIIDESDADDFIWAKVVRKVEGNRFRIRTNRPNVEVSWRVDADRNDPFVREYPTKDVVEKQGRERGTYQHPELYGMPKERGVNYRAK